MGIVGPTGVGKTDLALEVAQLHPDCEIVSVDSMTVYREFTVGTAKPSSEELGGLPYHLIDVASITEEFSLGRFIELFKLTLMDLEQRGKHAVLVGGTSLYLRSALDGMQPPPRYNGLRQWLEQLDVGGEQTASLFRILKSHDHGAARIVDPTNSRRVIRALEVSLGSSGCASVSGSELHAYPEIPTVLVGLFPGWEALATRIDGRIDRQLSSGWLEEVAHIMEQRYIISRTASQAIGYLELSAVVAGVMDFEEAVSVIKRRTRKLARRQLAWLRRDPRIVWSESAQEGREVIERELSRMQDRAS
ncbi:MAG: tRNA (adenosine(37)-N6)-dimethylallyltransferase MiaA [Acidimicrobiales bacterium]